ncbi:amino acid permease [Nitzschia inconspicua]|uniref:Amino acid permease n=1 Tax=Nitzschia inconspicua TaxID=303405 RepID=A0A9K3KBQ9_9STRA|nr:amino acid permease [Nitzschia inconspicua]
MLQADPLHTSPSPSLERRPQINGPWNRKSISLILELHGHPPCSVGQNLAGGNQDWDPSSICHPHHYSLLDLISMGVGGTVGSGIFVLTGFIAHHFAGPATFVSFLLSGIAALCSGLCYAEWSWRVPVEGSTYVYSFIALGEYAAVMAGACLTLEYGVSGAAVARSWGDKALEWMRVELGWTDLAAKLGGEGNNGENNDKSETFFNPLAGLVSLLAVVVLSCGVQESKRVTNIFTITKLLLVLFMIVGGFILFDAQNLKPLLPASLGASGVARGATSSFFGYLGFDEVCCLANEARNPADMPKAVLWTLAIVTVIYVLASIALCGMQDYEYISDTSGFPAAFADRGVEWAAQLTAAGEVLTLPVVVLISLLAQPRLFAAMAKDGLLPAIFAKQNADGNFVWGNVLSGVPMMFLATFVPFSWMDDAISVGILFAFNMTNTALILMKCNSFHDALDINPLSDAQDCNDDEGEGIVVVPTLFNQRQKLLSLPQHLLCYHCIALLAGISSHLETSGGNAAVTTVVQGGAAVAALSFALYIHRKFPSTGRFGDWSLHSRQQKIFASDETDHPEEYVYHRPTLCSVEVLPFEVPLVPFLPLVGVFVNWFLIAQLDWYGILLLLLFLTIISVLYLWCVNGSQKHAVEYSNHQTRYDRVDCNESEGGRVLLREFSLPKR